MYNIYPKPKYALFLEYKNNWTLGKKFMIPMYQRRKSVLTFLKKIWKSKTIWKITPEFLKRELLNSKKKILF